MLLLPSSTFCNNIAIIVQIFLSLSPLIISLALGNKSAIIMPVAKYQQNNYLIVPGQSTRQCECWKWQACISNCTGNPIISRLLSAEYEKIKSIPTPFIVIFPYQVRRQKHKKVDTNTLNKQGNYKLETNFWIHLLNGEDLQLQLHKSSIFGDERKRPSKFYLKYYQGSVAVISNTLKKCFYTGAVLIERSSNNELQHHSYVAADTCDGLRGLILYRGRVYGIVPIKHPQARSGEPVAHFIYPETTYPIERSANNLKTFWHRMKEIPVEFKEKDSKLIIPVFIYIDHKLMLSLDNDTEKASYFGLSLVNYITKAFISLKQLRIELAGIELWNLDNKIHISPSIKSTLNGFMRYHTYGNVDSSAANKKEALVGLLLSGQQFVEDVEYFSVPDSICTKRSTAVIQITSIKQLYHASRLMALAVAEMFGINRFPCPKTDSCYSSTVLSKGDQSRLKLALQTGQANCLIESMDVNKKPVINPCGNGRLDLGEECDVSVTGTGNGQSKNDLKCCDPKTCLMANYAQCNKGSCCSKNCTFLTRGRYCRSAKDQCDIPEFCSGNSGECPNDIFLENGQPCAKGSALCYEGRCPTRNSQCKKLWGYSARDSNRQCYYTYNLKLDDGCRFNGKCDRKDVMCGILHCSGGAKSLKNSEYKNAWGPQEPTTFNTYIKSDNASWQCKYFLDRGHGYVEDGSQCGDGKFCFSNKCEDASQTIQSLCPRNSTMNKTISSICYGRGVCTSLGVCLCHPGWTGLNCSVVVNGTGYFGRTAGGLNYSEQVKNYIWAFFKEVGIYNGPLYFSPNDLNNQQKDFWNELTSVHLIIIIGCTVGLIFLLIIILMVCYRRKIVHRSKSGFSSYEGGRRKGFNGIRGTKRRNRDDNDSLQDDNVQANNFSIDADGAAGNGSGGAGVLGRKNYFGNGSNRKSNDLRYDGGGKGRRGRRQRRRSSNGGANGGSGGNGGSCRRLCRDVGDGNESVGVVSDYGGATNTGNQIGSNYSQQQQQQQQRIGNSPHSDTDINSTSLLANGSNGPGNDSLLSGNKHSSNSMERMIKFGYMPSYKEDKMTSNRQPNPVIVQDADSLLMARSSDPLISNISPCNSEMPSLIRPVPDQINLNSVNNSSSISPISTQPISSPLKRNDPMMSFNNMMVDSNSTKLFPAPIGLPAPALFPNVPFNSNPSSSIMAIPMMTSPDVNADKIHDIVVTKQPEKGILKNKTENRDRKKEVEASEDGKEKERRRQHKLTSGSVTVGENSTTSPSSGSQSSLSSGESQSCSSSSSTSSSSSSSSGLSSLITHPNSSGGKKSCHSGHSNVGGSSSGGGGGGHKKPHHNHHHHHGNNNSSSSNNNNNNNHHHHGQTSQHHHHHHHHHHHSGKSNSNSGHNKMQPPTILCNAANQTDDNILMCSQSNSISPLPQSQREYLISSSNDYLEECDEEECEECIRLRQEDDSSQNDSSQQQSSPQQQQQQQQQQQKQLQHQDQQLEKSPPETLITSNSSAYDIVGSTDDNYHQYSNQEMTMMNYPCHIMPYPGAGNIQQLPCGGGGGGGARRSEDQSGQNSETEVDSHLQMLVHPVSVNAANHPQCQPFMSPAYLGVSTRPPNNNMESELPIRTTSNNYNDQSDGGGNYARYYPSGSSYYYPPITNHGIDLSRHIQDLDDAGSEVSISAYCRVPREPSNNNSGDSLIALTSGTGGNKTSDNKLLSATATTSGCQLPSAALLSSTGGGGGGGGSAINSVAAASAGSSGGMMCYEGASNDGTIEGSDTSSLPDAHCDLLNLAQLGIGPARPNPMLSQVLRANSKRNDPQSHQPTNPHHYLPEQATVVPWSANVRDEQNRSPGHLPNPNSVPTGTDYLA